MITNKEWNYARSKSCRQCKETMQGSEYDCDTFHIMPMRIIMTWEKMSMNDKNASLGYTPSVNNTPERY